MSSNPFETLKNQASNQIYAASSVANQTYDALTAITYRLNSVEQEQRQLQYKLDRMGRFMEYALIVHPDIMKDFDQWEQAKERLTGNEQVSSSATPFNKSPY